MKNQPNIVGRTFEAKALLDRALLGKDPWFRLDGVWYTQDETGNWFRMPDQPGKKKIKTVKKVNPT